MRFVGVDSEACSDAPNHRLVMVCAADEREGRWAVEDSEGLSTKECLDFLFMLGGMPDTKLISFAFNYDVNMILRDLTKDELTDLWDTGKVYLEDRAYETVGASSAQKQLTLFTPERGLEGITIRYVPSKFLEIRRGQERTRIDDSWGFYQSSFVTALEKWEIHDPSNIIERGKAQRVSFSRSDMPRMRSYCEAECHSLATLTRKLDNAIESAGIHIENYIGAGSIAQAFMRKHKVKDWHKYDEDMPTDVVKPIRSAYFGGRMEMFRQGYFKPAVGYDIRSAYPYEILKLPNLRGGTWTGYGSRIASMMLQGMLTGTGDTLRTGLWNVSWTIEPDDMVSPFPYRRARDGGIRYICNGKGWYWTAEVLEAVRIYGDRITIHNAYCFEPKDIGAPPFWFVEDIWAKRLQAKRAGLASEKVYKLGLNSLYGKCAQGDGRFGYGTRRKTQGKPPFQSFVWAGMITSGTRARLLSLIYPNRESIIGVATDGLLFKDDPGLPTGDNLGDLERTEYPELLYLMNGIYFGGKEKIVRTRGHHARDMDYDILLEGWRDQGIGFTHSYESNRFIGMGTALHRSDNSLWRTWKTEQRKLTCLTFSKSVSLPDSLFDPPGGDHPDYVTLYPWEYGWGKTETPSSAVYKPKSRGRNGEQDRLSLEDMLTAEQPD